MYVYRSVVFIVFEMCLYVLEFQPFKRQPHKMIKHTNTICRQIADELFECV